MLPGPIIIPDSAVLSIHPVPPLDTLLIAATSGIIDSAAKFIEDAAVDGSSPHGHKPGVEIFRILIHEVLQRFNSQIMQIASHARSNARNLQKRVLQHFLCPFQPGDPFRQALPESLITHIRIFQIGEHAAWKLRALSAMRITLLDDSAVVNGATSGKICLIDPGRFAQGCRAALAGVADHGTVLTEKSARINIYINHRRPNYLSLF